VPAAEYVYEARWLLADAAAGIENATRAHNARSHLKLAEP
jgi:hypothetical protein